MTLKIDSENWKCPIFAGSSLFLFTRYENLLWSWWFLCKNLANFGYPSRNSITKKDINPTGAPGTSWYYITHGLMQQLSSVLCYVNSSPYEKLWIDYFCLQFQALFLTASYHSCGLSKMKVVVLLILVKPLLQIKEKWNFHLFIFFEAKLRSKDLIFNDFRVFWLEFGLQKYGYLQFPEIEDIHIIGGLKRLDFQWFSSHLTGVWPPKISWPVIFVMLVKLRNV